MNVFSANLTQNLLSATVQRTAQLESLANEALKRGIDRYVNGDYEGAVKDFKRSVGMGINSPYAAEAANFMAKAYLKLNDSEAAIKAYETAIQIDPSRDDTHIELGNLYYALGRDEEAVQEYETAARLNPTAANGYSLGQAYLIVQRYADAEAQFREVDRVAPYDPAGKFGLGQVYSQQGRYEDAIRLFEQTLAMKPDFYDAYAEMGYAYADMGEMDAAQDIVHHLEIDGEADLADTLSRYMYKVDPPKMLFAYSYSTFRFSLPPKMSVVALDSYLATANASKTFNMVIQFDKEMDRESIENVANWQIIRAVGQGPGQAYNFGLTVPSTEVTISPTPQSVYYDEDKLTATVYFQVTQNASADGTIDPMHIEFKFNGKDIYGFNMDPDHDQFTGFSGTF